MRIIVDYSGLDALRARIAEARAVLPELLQEAAAEAGLQIVEALSEAAPVGQGEEGSTPPLGDAPGRLNESFYVQAEESAYSPGGAVSVKTTQPTKLRFVVEGRGEVRPKYKRALYWPGLAHPVRRAGPAPANDFVTPVVESGPSESDVLAVVAEQIAAILEA
ncbi:MAG: hypothetical protein PVSMB5_19960 [Ktedonobacteraceae bacterium]